MEGPVGDQDDEEEGVVLVQERDEAERERRDVRVPVIVHHPIFQELVGWKNKRKKNRNIKTLLDFIPIRT